MSTAVKSGKTESKPETNKLSKKVSASKGSASRIAVILIRSRTQITGNILDTLDMLKLFKRNVCVVVDDTPAMRGMVDKVKDYVTFGVINDDMYEKLMQKRAEEYKGRLSDRKELIRYDSKYVEHDGKKYKCFFRLSPPRKGYGRKGIKAPFVVGGALGNRHEKINDLIERML